MFVPTNRIIEVDHTIAKDMRFGLRRKESQNRLSGCSKKIKHSDYLADCCGLFQDSQVIAAWCELRQSYRHLRLDRIISYEVLSDNLPFTLKAIYSRWKKEILKETLTEIDTWFA